VGRSQYFGHVFNINHLDLSGFTMGLFLFAVFFLARSSKTKQSTLTTCPVVFLHHTHIEGYISDAHLNTSLTMSLCNHRTHMNIPAIDFSRWFC